MKVDWYLLSLTGALMVFIGIFTAIGWYTFR